jgi:hypothetical protein
MYSYLYNAWTLCNFTEMLTNPTFEPHFSPSCWVHRAAVRPEVAFLSCAIAGPTLSFADVNRLARRLKPFALANFGAMEVAVGETHKVRFVEHHAIEAQHRGEPAEPASAGSRLWPHIGSTRQSENLAFSLEGPGQGGKAGT